MAYIEPNTDLRILANVPLDPDYENTLYFDSLQAQTDYFLNKTVRTFSRNSYQRVERGVIKVGWPANGLTNDRIIRDMYNASYMMFKNTSYENKWFYAFVDKVVYNNNNTVNIWYHIDVMQTWHFDYILNQCLIEREHTESDVAGMNTLPEQLETGPYYEEVAVYESEGNVNNSGQYEYQPGVCLITSFDPSDLYNGSLDPSIDPVAGKVIYGNQIHGNIYSGAYYTIWPLSTSTVTVINDLLNEIVTQAKVDGVVALFMFPYDFRASLLDNGAAAIKTLTFYYPNTIGNYAPRNKKLLTYPYTMLYVSNNQGNTAEFRYECFNGNTPVLRVWGNVSPNGGMLCWPVDYKGYSGGNHDEAISLTGFPLCSWSFDAFKAWLSQNAGTLTAVGTGLLTSWATAIGGGIISKAGGDPLGLVGADSGNTLALPGNVSQSQNTMAGLPSKNLLGATLGALGQLYDHARKPPQMNGNGNLSLMYQAALLTFNFYEKHIREEYAIIIDGYFDMYGYSVNRIGTPSRANRRCYTYVKTIGCSIHGDMPNDAIKIIQGIFDNGVRFWRSSAVFGSYDPNVNDNTI